MIISHKHKFIFIHIPKTGGVSVYETLSKICGGNDILKKDSARHVSAQKIKIRVGDKLWNSYFKFAFVRNPWDRQLSLYFYIRKTQDNKYHKQVMKHNSFNEFILGLSRNHCVFPQQYNVTDDNNKLIVDFIGRLENIERDFQIICKRIGLPYIKLPHLNKSKHKHYAEYYTKETERVVAEEYKDDIEMFGYSFEKLNFFKKAVYNIRDQVLFVTDIEKIKRSFKNRLPV